MMIKRSIEKNLKKALQVAPVTMLLGARQVGKSTLAQKVARETNASYITFDSVTALAAASNDPQGYVANLPHPVVLDEIQRVPEIFLSLKLDVDQNRIAGRYLLTGSANVLSLPKIADSLAGRMRILYLYPLSQQEITGNQSNFVDFSFEGNFQELTSSKVETADLITRVLKGGYPEVIEQSVEERKLWFDSYLTTILQRDIQDLAKVEGLRELPQLLHLLAARSATLLNYSAISREAKLANTTTKRYISLFEATYLIDILPAWTANISKRVIKSPKLIFADTGLVCNILDFDGNYLRDNRTVLGQLLENFVALEIIKQASWSKMLPRTYHYRTHDNSEVDIVLEGSAGRLVGVEVKLAQSVGAKDFKGLLELRDTFPEKFTKGVLLYTGDEVVPFGEKLWAIPLNTLWELSA